MNAVETLRRLDACGKAVAWVEAQGDTSPEDLWQRCDRADWLVWLAMRAGLRRAVVELLCDCAEPLLADVPAGEERPRIAIETARRCVRGEATARETSDAARAADAAAYDAGADARAAAYAAACVAYAAYTAGARAAHAAAHVAYAAYTAGADARAAAYAALELSFGAAPFELASFSDGIIVSDVRRRIPWLDVRDALEPVR